MSVKKKFSGKVRGTLSITVTEFQREVLRRMCVKFGEPGVPLASMAATAFTRGLAVLLEELPVGLPELADERKDSSCPGGAG